MKGHFSHLERNDRISVPHEGGQNDSNLKISPCAFLLEHTPNLHRIEIEITTRCNLMCRHCDRRCSQAPADVDLSVSVIQQFVNESQALGYQWQKIGLLGGEPTLHPALEAVIEVLKDYVRTLDECDFFLVSNVHGHAVTTVLDRIRSDIAVVERPKNSDEPWFNNMNIAPLDVACSVSSCQITHDCGLGLTYLGYFPCGPAAAISRALGLDIGISSLKNVTEESMITLLSRLCLYCGHALGIPASVNGGTSPFWKVANEKYKALHTRIPYNRATNAEEPIEIKTLYGRRFQTQGASGSITCNLAAAAICQGGAPKRYDHTDPNEDSVLIAEGPSAVLMAVADAHGGKKASEVAIDWLATHCALRWTRGGMEKESWRLNATYAFLNINDAIIQENDRTGQSSCTTMVMCLLYHDRNIGFFATAGDSLAYLVGSTWVELAFNSSLPEEFFLGNLKHTLDSISAKCLVSDFLLDSTSAVVLATDGISREGIGFENPAAAILNISKSSHLGLSQTCAPLSFANRILWAARRAQKQNDSGDNIAVTVSLMRPYIPRRGET